MRHRKRYAPRRYGLRLRLGTVVFIIVAALLIIALIKADNAVKPVASMSAEHFAILTANEVIESSVSDYLAQNQFTYEELTAIVYDGSGTPVALEANPYSINKIQSELTLLINRRLESSGREYHKIPVGSLTGSYILAGKGPSVRIRVCPIGSADVELVSSLDSAGINQTRHRISAVITVNLSSSIPLYKFETQARFEFLISENVIVGGVPQLSAYGWNTSER